MHFSAVAFPNPSPAALSTIEAIIFPFWDCNLAKRRWTETETSVYEYYCPKNSEETELLTCLIAAHSVTPAGANTSTIARPKVGNVPYGVAITQCTVPGKVALTYDDGPYL
jgi:hypothetical protein